MGKNVRRNTKNRFDELKDFYESFDVILSEPKKDCNKCYGRGYVGIDSETDFPVMCKCIKFVSGEFDKESSVSNLNRDFRRKFLNNKNKKKAGIDANAIADKIKMEKDSGGE